MTTVNEAISDLNYAHRALKDVIADLTDDDIEAVIVDQQESYSVKESLITIVGWQQYVLHMLPQLVVAIDIQIEPIDPVLHNRETIQEHVNQPVSEIISLLDQNHAHILELLEDMSSEDLTIRRTMGDRVFTIKSYVIDLIESEMMRQADLIKASLNR